MGRLFRLDLRGIGGTFDGVVGGFRGRRTRRPSISERGEIFGVGGRFIIIEFAVGGGEEVDERVDEDFFRNSEGRGRGNGFSLGLCSSSVVKLVESSSRFLSKNIREIVVMVSLKLVSSCARSS